jgi:uncharacterized protein (TIGR02246 family)
MKKVIFFLGVILFGLTTFAQSKADLKSEEQAVRALSKNWMELTRKHEYAACAALFADDGISYSMNHDPFVGPDAIKKHFTEQDAKSPKADVTWTTERVEVASSGDMAVEYGKYNVKGLGPNGTDSDEGKYLTVYRKVNGTWKVAADIGTSTKPAPAQK